MARIRVSTTVDGSLLGAARSGHPGLGDAALIDAALRALLERNRQAELDEAYRAYDRLPLGTPDAWGDLESFLAADKT